MKLTYRLLAAVALTALAWPQLAAAQEYTDCPDAEDLCVVEWANSSTGEPILNALRNTIANDDPRPEGRVYVLRRGGFYYNTDHISNTDFHLRIVGQTAEEGEASGENYCGPAANEDCGPAIIQRFRREDGTVDGLLLESSGDGGSGFTLKNVWIMGMDNSGVTANYEPITINSSNSVFEMDNVVFDRNDWHHLGFKAGGNEIYITNSSFRNLTGPTQIWEGRGLRLEAGADVLVMENNSFINLTSFPVQSEAAPIDYFLFNHNTLVNFGRNFSAGSIWKEAYIANNIMVNPFWQGESAAQYEDRLAAWVADGNDPADIDPYTGVFSIAALPSQFGLELDRRILLANNDWWRSPDVEALYTPLGIRAQALVGDSTMSFFELYDGMVIENNLNQNPSFDAAPTTADVYSQMGTFLEQWVNEAPTPWQHLYWDPGRDENPQANIWPLPEDLSYSNNALLTAGTDGLPLGDLNWFPQAKDDYLANRDAYVEAVEELAGPPPEPPAANLIVQAESASALENATVQSVEGFTSFYMEGSGTINWTFDVPADGEYGLNVMTNMRTETVRGQHIRLDGTGLRNSTNYGEYFFCATGAGDPECDFFLAPQTWETVQIRQSDLIPDQAGALTLTAGTHTLQIAPSWGYQAFSTVEVVDAGGTVVASLTPPKARASGVQEICEAEGFCASGFQWVEVNAGGSVALTVDVPQDINSVLFRVFYRAPSGSAGTVLLDGVEQETLSFPATAGDGAGELATTRFGITPGAHQVTFTSSTGGLDLDYTIALLYAGAATATERDELPEGYALDQNYPNPFNPVTTIAYTMARAGNVNLTVFDVLGRKVATLAQGNQAAGVHQVRFDGAAFASGVYFYRLETPVGQQVRKMLLLK